MTKKKLIPGPPCSAVVSCTAGEVTSHLALDLRPSSPPSGPERALRQ